MNRAGPPPSAVAVRAPGTLAQVVDEVGKRAAQFDALLGPEHRERWLTVALHALAGNDKVLRQCDALSIVEAIRESATLNLSPTGLLGEGWIVPYAGKAQFQPGWRGYLKLLRASGQVTAVDSQVVYTADEFALSLGTSPSIHHVPLLYGEKNAEGEYLATRGEFRGVYAWARMTTGDLIIEWMSWDDVMAIKARSRSKDDGPWVTDPGEMGRKSVIRRMVKRLPLETMPMVAHAAVIDEQADAIAALPVPEPTGARATAAAYALAHGATDEPVAAPEASESVTEASTPEPVACGDQFANDGDPCVLPKGHDGDHQDAAGGVWSRRA